MKNIFFIFCLSVLFFGSACGQNPSGMPSISKFVLAKTFSDCGVMQRFKVYEVTDKELWIASYLPNSYHPYMIQHEIMSPSGRFYKLREIWIDNDSDGHIDEYFESLESLQAKYYNYCNAIKK